MNQSLVYAVFLAAGASHLAADVGHAAPLGSAVHVDQAQADSEAETRAAELFDRGQVHYDGGSYAQAIDLFRQAHRLVPEPAVVFAIAQAQRRSGDCTSALTSYRAFLRTDPQGALQVQAAQHANRLALICPQPSSPTVPKSEVRPVERKIEAPSVRATVNEPHPTGRRGSWVAGVGGGLLGAVGAGLFVWNTTRFETWQGEDNHLRTPFANEDSTVLGDRQEANDNLSRSIRRVDQAAYGFAATAAALLLTAGIMYLLDGPTGHDRRGSGL